MPDDGALISLQTGERLDPAAITGPLETAQAELYALLRAWQERGLDSGVVLAALADAEAWMVQAMRLPHEVERTALMDMGQRTVNTLLRLKRLAHLERAEPEGRA
jgi:hypothetical protein